MEKTKKTFDDYFIGLDIGTDSIGWAVTNQDYEIPKFNSKAMWGIRLFESGETAEARRMQRAARRRTQRRVQRIALLQELFTEEISKVDEGFYLRLKESKYHSEDKTENQRYSAFNDELFTDKQYYKLYPTIYHVRKALIDKECEADIRLIYLAIHHIIKHRGHFLFEDKNMESVADFDGIFTETIREYNENWDLEIEIESLTEIKELVKSNSLSLNDKKRRIDKLLYINKEEKMQQVKAIGHCMIGASVELNNLFDEEAYVDENGKGIKISFRDGKYDESYDELESQLNENMYYLDQLKSIYDWGILDSLLQGKRYLSYAKVEVYDKHKKDLVKLKKLIRQYFPKEIYVEVFKDTDSKVNYCAYIGKGKKNGNKKKTPNKCGQEDFLKYIGGKLKSVKNPEDTVLSEVLQEIEQGTFIPKQVNTSNGVIPHQVHLAELEKILSNYSKDFPFLEKKDENGLSIQEKILMLFKFRIPYYVGPLNDAHREKGNCWITKKQGSIRPWNFEEMVDLDQCAQDFIMRMTNKCTYLLGADVLPKNSLLYSEFSVLNELNNLRINGERINVELRDLIYQELFMKKKKVTQKGIKQLLKNHGYGDQIELAGIDGDFKNSLSSYIEMKNILGDKVENKEMVEDLIRWIVLFGNDKKMLKRKVQNNYSKLLSDDEVKRVSSLKYAGWGRLSREFLTEIYHVLPQTGELFSILQALKSDPIENSPKNLMELLSRNYDYVEAIDEYNHEVTDSGSEITYDLVKELYVSPAVKRSIWQTLKIVKEITGITKKQPKKVFIEVARGPEEIKQRTVSRKNQLIERYKAIKGENHQWIEELNGKSDGDLRSDRLYLYYSQMGRCMYSGENIDLSRLYDANLYDVDHIYPQSRIKDDSLENRVLVKRTFNADKKDEYPLNPDIRKAQFAHWQRLYQLELIGKKKFERLTRNTPFTDDELADFIARQLVETRQSTKAVAQVLNRVLNESEIVYVKAANVSRFRQHLFELIKCREVNDYHHAKDAYLNIVVGNVYHTKFTNNPLRFIKEGNRENYSMNEKALFYYDITRNGYYAWKKDVTIMQVKKTMAKNNILFTRRSYENRGQLFDLLPLRKGLGQLSLKGNEERLKNINKYGGYNNIKGAYFVVVDHIHKKKLIRSFEHIPVYLADSIEKNSEKLESYLKDELGLDLVKVIVPKVKMYSLIKIDGFPVYITGRSNQKIILSNALQLVVDESIIRYIKIINKYVEKLKNSKKMKLPLNEPNHFDRLDVLMNIKTYEVFFEKLNNSLYGVLLSAQKDKFAEGKEKFIKLDINNQVLFLYEVVKLFQCNRLLSDLSLIGAAANAGTLTINKSVSENNNSKRKITLVNQSVTGLFENETNLSEI